MIATAVSARPRPPRSRTRPGRLLRLELRRSPMLGMLPLIVVLFWLDTYRQVTGLLPFWGIRSMTLQLHVVADFGPFVAGAAAWAARARAAAAPPAWRP